MNALGWMQPLLTASLMMAAIGAITIVLFQIITVRSWKIRSWLVAAVLLQGLMLIRAPIDLAWLPPAERLSPPSTMAWEGLADLTDDLRADAVGSAAVQSIFAPVVTTDQREIGISISWMTWVALVWAAVAIGIVLTGLSRYVRTLRMVGRLPAAPQSWQSQWHRVAGRSNRCDMFVSQALGPMLIRRPTGYALVVPRSYWESLRDDQRESVLLHELAHLQRRDVWRQLVARFIATLHWFNPFAWWALRQYEWASECACDGRVTACGRRAAAGFASALVQLVQWDKQGSLDRRLVRGVGFQSMAAPPLKDRVSRLLQNNSTGESLMKRLLLASLAIGLVAFSFFQIRLTTAQDGGPERERLRVIDAQVADRLQEVVSRLDSSDATTERLIGMMDNPSGKIAVAGYLDSLAGRAREEARLDAVPRFIEHHFDRNDDDKLVPRDPATAERWIQKSHRLADDIRKLESSMQQIAAKMDTSSEVGGLFKRLLQDPQAPVAVLINEMDGGDVVARFLSEALENLLVEQADGTFRIVDSRRREAEEQIERFEMAEQLGQRLQRALPNLAAEYSDEDERHRQLIQYMRHPLMASVAALHLSDDAGGHAALAVEKLYEHFEEVSRDTPTGLKIANPDAWEQLNEMYSQVDRAAKILPRIREKLVEYSERLTADDPLTMRLAEQMHHEPLAVLLASELPYAEANPGEELEALLSEVMIEKDGKWVLRKESEQEVGEKARELLQVCRRIRRYTANIEQLMDQFADRQLVDDLGEAGRYLMLSEIRRFAEQHRPDPITLMQDHLLAETDDGKLRVREDRREVVRDLVAQAERVRSEAANDDF